LAAYRKSGDGDGDAGAIEPAAVVLQAVACVVDPRVGVLVNYYCLGAHPLHITRFLFVGAVAICDQHESFPVFTIAGFWRSNRVAAIYPTRRVVYGRLDCRAGLEPSEGRQLNIYRSRGSHEVKLPYCANWVHQAQLGTALAFIKPIVLHVFVADARAA